MLMQFSVDKLSLHCAENAFGVARKYLALREELKRESGAFGCLTRNLIRTVDYQSFIGRAIDIKGEVKLLTGNASSGPPPHFSPEQEFRQALHDYITALAVASEICYQKAVFLAKKARSASTAETSYSDFQKIIRDEEYSLQRCQAIGRRLSTLYRLLSAQIPPREC
jgi:hypothetical protein